jgi:uncharacterized protein GlcG (DUF336 family)
MAGMRGIAAIPPAEFHMALNTTQSEQMVQSAVRKATQLGVPVHIAILDAGAHLKAFLRMDGAPLGSLDVALKKARTAVLFEMNSEAVRDYLKPGAAAQGLELTNGVLVTFAGGIPIKSTTGEILGAIGVSGGTVPQDFEIATAGSSVYQPG